MVYLYEGLFVSKGFACEPHSWEASPVVGSGERPPFRGFFFSSDVITSHLIKRRGGRRGGGGGGSNLKIQAMKAEIKDTKKVRRCACVFCWGKKRDLVREMARKRNRGK